MASNEVARSPWDPSDWAYSAGRELARRVDDSLDHPFFGQTQRTQTHKRSVHVISENEYILTEETTTTDVVSFFDDIFSERRWPS